MFLAEEEGGGGGVQLYSDRPGPTVGRRVGGEEGRNGVDGRAGSDGWDRRAWRVSGELAVEGFIQ